jgi:DNA-binding NarL/FixJ family response regulator
MTTRNHALTAVSELPALPPPPILSSDDLSILRMLADGQPYTAIGRRLFLSTSCVKSRVQLVCKKLGATSREHAAALGVVHCLVTADHLTGLPVVAPTVRDSDRPFLALAIIGGTEAEIATRLNRSLYTVRDSLRHLRREFCARDRAQLAAAAVVLGYVTCRTVDLRFPDVPLASLATTPNVPGGGSS